MANDQRWLTITSTGMSTRAMCLQRICHTGNAKLHFKTSLNSLYTDPETPEDRSSLSLTLADEALAGRQASWAAKRDRGLYLWRRDVFRTAV